MRDGLYKVTLRSGALQGFLIGTVYEGRITGCDQTHHVTGEVVERCGRIKGAMVMRRHDKPEGFIEIANLDTITVSFAGIAADSVGQFDATVAEKPGLEVKAVFQYLGEI